MNRRSRFLLCLLALVSVQCHGQEAAGEGNDVVSDAESRFLFINFLEFLGEFETEDGDWINPDLLDDEALMVLDDQQDGSSIVSGRTALPPNSTQD